MSEVLVHSDHVLLKRVETDHGARLVQGLSAGHDAQGARAALESALHILQRLQCAVGCPRPRRLDPERLELILDDPGGVILADSGLLGRVDLARFLSIAESLGRLLAAIHGRGVIHQCIDPSLILIHPEDDQVWLLDFTRATTLAEMPSTRAHLRPRGGNPLWWSPEQTGRMNRPIDQRADLYALGLVFYALATGAPPFTQTDPLTLVHAHLALDPASPRGRAPWLPEPLERLILTLLAKEPDDRYQSAEGLSHDLGRLRAALREGVTLDSYRLRERDPPLYPRPPRRLHGRDAELATLMSAFMEVTEGPSQAIFVAGYSGVGKTALIQEILRPVALSQGWLVSGKCEQFQRDRPLLAPAHALGQLCQLLLVESPEGVASWRRRILEGVGRDGAALFEILPDLRRVLGAQPPVPVLGAFETERRLLGLLVRLVLQIASFDRPLVLFLDDLQWADQPTLDLIDAVLGEAQIQGLLLIGAYRDNEVDAAHPLAALLSRLGASARILSLSNLRLDALTRLISEMLRMPVDDSRGFAAQLHEKTGGNPFFTLELLDALYRAGALRLDREQGRWTWCETTLLRQSVSANVADLLAAGLAELPDDTNALLLAAACLGEGLNLDQLALVTGRTRSEVATSLTPALERGVLTTDDALALQLAAPGVGLRFCHDRMQQAAYQLHGPAEQARMHQAIALRLIDTGGAVDRFRAAEHCARATDLLLKPVDRARARRLFADAALQARRAGAFAAAERFLRLGLAGMDDDVWQSDPALAFDLQTELHLVLYSQARQVEADQAYARLVERARSPLHLIEPTCAQIANLSNRLLYREAIDLGCGLLEQLGMPVPLADLDRTLQEFLADNPDAFCEVGTRGRRAFSRVREDSALDRELVAFYRYLDTGAVEALGQRGEVATAHVAGAVRLINSLVAPASITHLALAGWLPLRVGRLWIEAGYTEAAIYPLLAVGQVVLLLCGDFSGCERVMRTVLSIGEAREGGRETARGRAVYANYACHWMHPVEESVSNARQAFTELTRFGDLEFAAFTLLAALPAHLDICAQLSELEAEVQAALSFARKIGNHHCERGSLVYRQLIRALEGRTTSSGGFDDADFDERAFVASVESVATRSARVGRSRFQAFILRRVPFRYLFKLATWRSGGDPWGNPVALCFFHIYRALAACVFNDGARLVQHADTALALSQIVMGNYPSAHLNLLHSLSLTERLRATPAAGRAGLIKRLGVNQTWLAARAADAPVNFSHLHDLVEAERLDALGEPWAALQRMERAMRLAQAHRRPWHSALITERAGLLHMRHGLEHSARPLLTRAYRLYLDWGATGKAEAMRSAWPFVVSRPSGEALSAREAAFDQAALARASEALASEESRAELVPRVMELVAGLTGATDVRFVALEEGGQWSLEGGLRGSERLGAMALPAAESHGLVPMSVLRLGIATQRPLVSDDAVLDRRFAADPYFAKLPLCALMGLPVVVQGRVRAFLVLENRHLRAAFDAEQVAERLGDAVRDLPELQSLRFASLGGLVALHSVLDGRNQALRDAHDGALEQARQALDEVRRERALRHRQGQFIDLVTHEYRTPLAIMQANLDILMLSQDTEHWREGLRNMDLAIQRLGEVFDGSLRRGDWGEQSPMQLIDMDLGAWLAGRVGEVQALWPAPSPKIDLRIQGAPCIRADPALLKTALINLLDNARKYGPPAGPIQVALTTSDDGVVLSVGNDCTTALDRSPQELLAKSVRGANSRDIPGLGLGLYLVDKLTSDLGGRLELGEQPGRFEIRLIFPSAGIGGAL